jgi:hypothetical protein
VLLTWTVDHHADKQRNISSNIVITDIEFDRLLLLNSETTAKNQVP